MNEVVLFLQENGQSIVLLVVAFLALLVFIELKNIDLNPPPPASKLVQEVTMETFHSNNHNNNAVAFDEDGKWITADSDFYQQKRRKS